MWAASPAQYDTPIVILLCDPPAGGVNVLPNDRHAPAIRLEGLLQEGTDMRVLERGFVALSGRNAEQNAPAASHLESADRAFAIVEVGNRRNVWNKPSELGISKDAKHARGVVFALEGDSKMRA